MAQANEWLVPFTGMGNTGGRVHLEGIGDDKINLGYTGFENHLRNLSGGLQRVNEFMNRLLKDEIRDKTWIWEPSD